MMEKGDTEANVYQKYSKISKLVSVVLILPPTVMMYLNQTFRLAVASSALAVLTENIGKLWIIYSSRTDFSMVARFSKENAKLLFVSLYSELDKRKINDEDEEKPMTNIELKSENTSLKRRNTVQNL